MNRRRSPLLLAPLLGLASLPLVTGIPAAGAAPAGHSSVPAARAPKPGQPGGGDQGSADKEKTNCPTALWTIPLEIKGFACILLLPKQPPQPPADGSPSTP